MVLKGSGSVIAAPGQPPRINPSGNALLATAGTGDVLAGMIGACWTQAHAAGVTDAALQATRRAVWQHGALADEWPEGVGLRAGELLAGITPWQD